MHAHEKHEKTILTIKSTINQFKTMSESFHHIEPLILNAFGAQRMSIFQRRSEFRDLVARYKTGNELRQLKVSISTQSVAGYVAMAHQSVILNDVQDDNSLKNVYIKLRYERKFDKLGKYKTKQLLCVPIMSDGILLGVLQIVNKQSSDFTENDLHLATSIAEIFADKFKFELGGTANPFDYLVHTGTVKPATFEHLLSNSSIRQIAQNLINEQKASVKQVGEALAIFYQVAYIPYLPNEYFVKHANTRLNLSYLKRNLVAVVADKKEQLIVLMNDPSNSDTLMEVESALGTSDYQLAYGLADDILQYLGEQIKDSMHNEFDEILDEIDTGDIEQEVEHEAVAEDEPIVARLVTSFLTQASRMGASDIHIDPDKSGPTEVRMRIDGIMRDITQIPASHHLAVVARIKIMSGLNIAEKRIPQDGKLGIRIQGKALEARVSTIPTVKGEGVTIRILSASNAIPIDKLNLSSANLKRLKNLMTLPHGVFLVVGPTGSGKTTSLHAILGHLNTPEKKIWTAEDPVEITQYRLNQVQINPKIGVTFANALRSFLRADPDIILIGEMRDKETAHAGVEASLTGHLVLSTLHTNSAPETITRLLDMGIDPVNFSDACVGILAQRLIRTLCDGCKRPYKASKEEVEFIHRQYGEQYLSELRLHKENVILCKSSGCKQCDNTGYLGRTAVHELLTMSPELRSMVFQKASITELKVQAMSQGMRTLSQDAVLKVLTGLCDIPQVQSLSGVDIWNE